jgi:hypothetical protein
MLLGSREQRFNGFVAEDEQCCHGPGPLWNSVEWIVGAPTIREFLEESF